MIDKSNRGNAVELKFRGTIALITLNKPRKLNALTKDEFYQLAQALYEVASHDEIITTVLTGRGRFFSAYVRPRKWHGGNKRTLC